MKSGEKKDPKRREEKYEKPLIINGSFLDVIKVSVKDNPKPKEKNKEN